MQVLCLVGNNGRSARSACLCKTEGLKSPFVTERNFTEVEVETLVGEMEARKVVLFGKTHPKTKSRVSGNMLLQQ